MNQMIDPVKLISTIKRFEHYIRHRDGLQDEVISFEDKNTFLGREENYKSKVSVLANEELRYEDWKKSWIGKGEISRRAARAMSKAGNLVHKHQQIKFKDMLDPTRKEYIKDAELVLYNIYKSATEEEVKAAFDQAKRVFGGHYDTIAYLFFVKDKSKYLPVSPGNFEKSLASIGIDYKLSGRCSWDNYLGFIEIVKQVHTVMQMVLQDVEIRLIDAHSFLWVISEDKRKTDYLNWNPDEETEAVIEQEIEDNLRRVVEGHKTRKSRVQSYFTRSAEVVRITKERARGVCQLCKKEAPFHDKKGQPYLETHHVIWLSRGGADSTDNTVALCPNCHTRIHVLDDPMDTEKLNRR